MSYRVGNVIVICDEKPQQCDLCGKVDELRPYGPHGEAICYDCGEKNPDTTERMMRIVLFGDLFGDAAGGDPSSARMMPSRNGSKEADDE